MQALTYILASLSPIQPNGLPKTAADNNTLPHILQIVFGIAGALAFLMIVVSGLRYVLSDGNPEKTARARDGVIYALVGLVIAVVAEGIVGFVVNNL